MILDKCVAFSRLTWWIDQSETTIKVEEKILDLIWCGSRSRYVKGKFIEKLAGKLEIHFF